MDIPLPEQGIRFSFKKLGGNPFMTLSFRKHGTFSKLFYLFFLLAVFVGLLRISRWHFPAERITLFFKDKNLSDTYELFIQSRLVKIIPTLMMIVSIFLGLPWLLMGLGLNTVLLLRYLSIKRYEKIDYISPFNYRIFLKYSLSYLILASSLLLIVTSFHPVFFISLAVSTFLNCAFVAIYAVLYFFTQRKIIVDVEEEKNGLPPTSPPLKHQ